jgi:hypothetical protein
MTCEALRTLRGSFAVGRFDAVLSWGNSFGYTTPAAVNRYNPASGAHHVHTTGEVVRMLQSAGFSDIDLKGPDGVKPYALGDFRMIAVAV